MVKVLDQRHGFAEIGQERPFGGTLTVHRFDRQAYAGFRGVRQQLMRTFPRIAVLDLHGNLKKKERAPDGGPDQSVFDIGAGIR
jgi:hypothetical protein